MLERYEIFKQILNLEIHSLTHLIPLVEENQVLS